MQRWLVGLLGLWTSAVFGAARVPASDGEVLERLPVKPADSASRELRRLREAQSAAPQAPAAAAALARRYFELAMAEGDPRYVGYAEGVLQPWKGSTGAPAEILLLQGLLRQYRHDFAGGLEHLARALERDPAMVEAHAWRAAIYMVQADYDRARQECAALAPKASELFSAGCRTSVESVTGNAASAYEQLRAALERSPDASGELKLWCHTRLAEMASRLGREAVAERHFKDARALGITDNFLLAAYADFLLERGRPADALRLLKDRERSDTLLLRIALAERALKSKAAGAHERVLAERFHDSALRGERLHLGEEARFLLELRGDAKAALQAASENWRSQREPRDAEIFLRAALAARDASAAAPVLAWLKASRYESARLAALADQLQKSAK